MSNTDDNNGTGEVKNLPAVETFQRVPIMAGAAPRALVPVDFDGCYRIARVVVEAGMAPPTLDSIPKAMVAILHGLEVGLTPMQALQSIAVINGKPTIWGDAALALIYASGKMEWIEEVTTGQWGNDNYTAVCRVLRAGPKQKVMVGEFSIGDAKTAKIWEKRGRNGQDTPWITYPKRMVKMRARWVLRDAFADVLKGLHLREEVEDIEPTAAESATVTRRRAPPPPAEEKSAEEIKEAAQEQTQDEPAKTEQMAGLANQGTPFPGDTPIEKRAPPPPSEEEVNVKEWMESLENAYSACEDTHSMGEQQDRLMMPMKDKVPKEDWQAAVRLTIKHVGEITERNSNK
jgi:hypothetical protein